MFYVKTHVFWKTNSIKRARFGKRITLNDTLVNKRPTVLSLVNTKK